MWVGYYQNNVQAFADVVAPLTELLKKKNPFIMGTKQIEAWNLLKEQTLKATELAFYNPNLENKVYTDASNIGIGGVYTQVNENGIERPVKFLSRKLTEVEQTYDTVSKELLAITYTLQKLRKYWEDHLLYIQIQVQSNGYLQKKISVQNTVDISCYYRIFLVELNMSQKKVM